MSPVTDWPRVDLDSGGMARVYLALQPGRGGAQRVVAVKEMHPHLAKDPECRLRFLDEARITARVHHPNVVEVLELVQARDGPRIVMEYVHGASLSLIVKRLVSRGDRMPERHIAAVMEGLLTGLHAAHEAKTEDGVSLRVVHRDVTPRNILVGVDGVPRLIDFGIARAALRDAPATRTGVARGTPYYMAPEQLGDGVVSRGTDIFLCGLILWELTTGRRLSQTFQNEGQFWLMVAQGRMPRASEYAPWLDPEIERVIERALAVSPEERHASAEAMRDAIVAALPPSSAADLGAWVTAIAADDLARRERLIVALRAGAPAEPEPTAEEQDGGAPGTMTWSAPDTATETVQATMSEAMQAMMSDAAQVTRKDGALVPGAEPREPPRPAPAPEASVPGALAAPPRETLKTLSTDEKTTLPILRGEPTFSLAEPDPGPPARRRAGMYLAAALLLALGVIVGLIALRPAPPARGEAAAPSSLASALVTGAAPGATGAAPAQDAPAAPPPASAEPVASAQPLLGPSTAGGQASAPAIRGATPAPSKPASSLGCTYKDDKGITRVTSCSSGDCRRRGRACKPIGPR